MTMIDRLSAVDRAEKAIDQLTKQLADVMHPVLFQFEEACVQTQTDNRLTTMRLARKAALKFVKARGV